MKLRSRYRELLSLYLLWSREWVPPITFPYPRRIRQMERGRTAEEAMQRWESLGKKFFAVTDLQKFMAYIRGKTIRDFWVSEIASTKQMHVIFFDEEFGYFHPETFCDLFGRWPRPHLVRYFYDNNYGDEQFQKDAWSALNHNLELEQGGFRCWGWDKSKMEGNRHDGSSHE